MIDALIKLLLAYMLGSLMGGLIVGRLRGQVDIRTAGSGNAGATNAWRTQGPLFGIAVFVIDIAKGVIAVLVLPSLPLPFLEPSQALSSWLPYSCGLAAVLGHVYPLFFGFRGGKGAATLIGIMFCLMTPLMPLAVMVWLGTLLLTGIVGLSTMLAIAAVAVMANMHAFFSPAGVFGVLALVLTLYTHRANIQRMRDGNENRFDKVRITYWLSRKRSE